MGRHLGAPDRRAGREQSAPGSTWRPCASRPRPTGTSTRRCCSRARTSSWRRRRTVSPTAPRSARRARAGCHGSDRVSSSRSARSVIFGIVGLALHAHRHAARRSTCSSSSASRSRSWRASWACGSCDGSNVGTDPQRSEASPVALVARMPDNELPIYTILVPAYREANIVAKVIEHMSALDYPMSKLQVLLLMEADDDETDRRGQGRAPARARALRRRPAGRSADQAQGVQRRARARRRRVPRDLRRRGPSGAEPAPRGRGALRRDPRRRRVPPGAAQLLQRARERPRRGMFTLEYSFWFDYMLPGLDAMRAPDPARWDVEPLPGRRRCASSARGTRTTSPRTPTSACAPRPRAGRSASPSRRPGKRPAPSGRRGSASAPGGSRGTWSPRSCTCGGRAQLYRETGARGVLGLLGLIAGTPLDVPVLPARVDASGSSPSSAAKSPGSTSRSGCRPRRS